VNAWLVLFHLTVVHVIKLVLFRKLLSILLYTQYQSVANEKLHSANIIIFLRMFGLFMFRPMVVHVTNSVWEIEVVYSAFEYRIPCSCLWQHSYG